MRIGRFELTGRALLAPMAGVTDRPFRMLCRRFGAAPAASLP
jgi:tRNA-dihydrouridine synthase B